MNEYVYLFDTTLRDGLQTSCVGTISSCDKQQYINEIEKYNFDYIEVDMIDRVKNEENPLKVYSKNQIYLCLPNIENIKIAKEYNIKYLQILIKCDTIHINDLLNKDEYKYLEEIIEFITISNQNNIEILCIIEHFFDSFEKNKEYIFIIINSIIKNGCKWITFADTNGNTLTSNLESILDEIFLKYDFKYFGIHAHNDIDLATANSIAAVNKGVRMVQGTWNGMGERCGNANLISVFCTLYFKLKYNCCISDENFKCLTESSRKIENIFGNINMESTKPYVGKNAFSHKAGLHINAVKKKSSYYEHINPELIGNSRNIVLSDMIGTSTLTDILNERPDKSFLKIAKNIIEKNKDKANLITELNDSYNLYKLTLLSNVIKTP